MQLPWKLNACDRYREKPSDFVDIHSLTGADTEGKIMYYLECSTKDDGLLEPGGLKLPDGPYAWNKHAIIVEVGLNAEEAKYSSSETRSDAYDSVCQ